MCKDLIIYLWMLFLCSLDLFSQTNTHLHITAKGAEGKSIKLIIYEDFISYREKIIASGAIDASGEITLDCRINKMEYALLDIENNRGEIYIEPAKKLQVIIDPASVRILRNQLHPFEIKYELGIDVSNEDSLGINRMIGDCNNIFNYFIIDNFESLYESRNKLWLDSLQALLESKFPIIKYSYFKDLIFYKSGLVALLVHNMSTASMIKKYFLRQPVMYSHVDYMDLFNEVFTNYLLNDAHDYDIDDLLNIINEKKDYFGLLNMMGSDTLLQNEVFRELVMLKGLSELYFKQGFDRGAIINMLKEFAAKTKFKEHSTIALNLTVVLCRLQPGTPAPAILVEPDISLNTYKGKYVYLNFFAADCEPCLPELENMKQLYGHYKQEIEFISISVDFNKMKFDEYMKKKSFDWPLFYYDGQEALLEKYQIRYIPLYVLIDREGKIIEYPARAPDENIDLKIELLLNKEKRKN